MADMSVQVAQFQVFNQFWVALFLLIPMVLVARIIVANTNFSPILFIVVIGLVMGHILVAGGVSTPGLPEFQLVDFLGKATIIPLMASFFVGGQELRKVFGKMSTDVEDLAPPSPEEVSLGTNKGQFIYIFGAFFLLLGIESAYRFIVGMESEGLTRYFPFLAFVGIACALVLIDYKAILRDKKLYVRRGVIEIVVLVLILVVTINIANGIADTIALPQIFFAMLISCGLGLLFYKWRLGPTSTALLFAGLPIVLAGNFLVGGSRLAEVVNITGMDSVMGYGFFGQMAWMFGGIALMMFVAKSANIRNLAPGLAGGLSHMGLTGACNAGDFGSIAKTRAPIMINIPFMAHVFVFSILAISAERGALMMTPSIIILVVGVVLLALSLKSLRAAKGEDGKEVRGLIFYALGLQLTALFGSFVLLSALTMPIGNAAMSVSAALSHFGLFAATQGGMFGAEAAALIPVIFSMPFLVHPLVFFMFGKAVEKDGDMPKKPVLIFALIGIVGVIISLSWI